MLNSLKYLAVGRYIWVRSLIFCFADINWIKRFNVCDWGVAQTRSRIILECKDFYRDLSDAEKLSCLLRIVTFIDLTSLGGNDTSEYLSINI